MAERATGVLTITTPFQTPTLMARKRWLHRPSGILLLLRSSGLTRRHIHAMFGRTCGQIDGVSVRIVSPPVLCGPTMAQVQFCDGLRD